MIDTILIPVDGSAASMKAARFGGDLAKHYGARVVLLHVLLHQNLAEALRGLAEAERDGLGGGLGGLAETLGRKTLDDLLAGRRTSPIPPAEVLEFIAKQVVEAADNTVRAHGATDVRTAVERGDPVKRILEYADKENADVIVMGARGLSGLETLVLGSVSQKIAHLSRHTCITVR